MEEDDLTKQVDEIEAMSAIYGDDWCVVDEINRIYSITISYENDKDMRISLQVLLPDEYPSKVPPVTELSAPWLSGGNRILLESGLAQVCLENSGESVLYLMVERIQEFMAENATINEDKESENSSATKIDFDEDRSDHTIDQLASSLEQFHTTKTLISNHGPQTIELPPLVHGDTITDRKSTFQAHIAFPVVEAEQVKCLLHKLRENKKIAHATHNVMAYRIYKEDHDSFIQDCDDDGETAAGGRLLHLLQIVDARNVMVVVSRWYGGIHLGPDRFKHINNAARSILNSSGFIQNKDSTPKSKKTKSKNR
ncbi:protein IMPACT [Strongylocentrotus purpuratus]|uniref:RWD domain-containing protein n=1 Tax=Strongylocentrotus purpuratus TaxID=7668 RepID=A0A7M7SUC3_STRPU|nr:protein IMPACT [Strongylocentrotus purpuratus]